VPRRVSLERPSSVDVGSPLHQDCTLLTVIGSFHETTVDDVILEDYPAYLLLIFGLIFSEEFSLSWTNVAMSVRGLPSISAYEIVTQVESDWLRKALLLCLAAASVTTGTAQKICTLGGISLACCILLANLGSRSWKFMGWRPTFFGDACATGFTECITTGFLEPSMSYVLAVMTGICFPYLGCRQVQAGGTDAMESVLRIAVGVAAVFFISDYDEIQRFLVIGSQNCDQKYVNIAVGIWWCLSLVACLVVLNNRLPAQYFPDYKEPLLTRDEASPVGFKVPHLPDFPIDPIFGAKGSQCFSIRIYFVGGMFVAAAIGGALIYLGASDVDDELMANGS
jgi:hypothetical protein